MRQNKNNTMTRIKHPLNRREWLKKTGMLAAGLALSDLLMATVSKKNPTILLVSGWQDVNIGDIAHTPGLLHVLETFLPGSKIILWKKSGYNQKVSRIYSENFPNVRVLYGNVNEQKEIDNPELLEAFNESDILLHGSGPLLVGADHVASWIKHTGKPFGVFGVTLQNPNEYHQELLKKAAFIFTRETHSIQHLKKTGIEGGHIGFVPDATFFLNIRDDKNAEQFMASNKLEAKKFICAIPRLRVTPYYKFNPNNAGWSDKRIEEVEALNERCKEWDHAKMREAMIAWVRETGNKVLVCPEMTYQVDIMDELLINPLPDDVKPFVVKRGYWLPDEAASIYSHAHTVLSFECHSPIIAATTGTPFFYLRQPEDTIKGQMYYDLNFEDWVFEIEETEGAQITGRLREIWNNYPAAKAKLKAQMDKIGQIYSDRVEQMNTVIDKS
jgi:polysaccharide pyruvyl transferase WcaK-like protein